MGTSVVVDSANFETEVLQQSYEKIVLVDFFATWCGPCQLLKPMLEKLVKEYDFVLAKVDIDQNPDLANAYGIEGVPDVRVVTKGDVLNGFVGVLPEPKLRQFLAQLNLTSGFERGLQAVQVARTAGDMEEAQRLLQGLIEQYPDNRMLTLELANFLLNQNQLEAAEKVLSRIQDHEREYFPTAQALRGLIQFKRDAETEVVSELDQVYVKASKLAIAANYEEALQYFLEIVGRDRNYRQDGARKSMLTIFGLLGDDHPLTRHYRKQLTLALY
jgi:putative thioredoxin